MKQFSGIYPEEIEKLMKQYYDSLSEKYRRQYAAIESLKIEFYGEAYISRILNVTRKTIKKGKKELIEGSDVPNERTRAVGGGRNKIIDKAEYIHDTFMEIMQNHTAGSPMDENIKWTDLTPKEISLHFKNEGKEISVHIVKQLLKIHGFVKRQAQKTESFKNVEERDEQFENIKRIKSEYIEKGTDPIISMDVKKITIRELL